MIVARAPLAASCAPCSRTLKRGEFKRVPRSGSRPAVGWFLSCAACGFVSAFSAEELLAVENVDELCHREVALVAVRGAVRCYSCHRLIAIDGQDLVAVDTEG